MEAPTVIFIYVSFFLFNWKNMAVAPICFKMCYKDQPVNNLEILGGISPLSNYRVKKLYVSYNCIGTLTKPNKNIFKCTNTSERDKPSSFTLRSSSKEKQLKSLDSYFGKFKNDKNQSSPSFLNDDRDTLKKSVISTEERGTALVGEFFGKRALAKVDDRSGLARDYDETSDLYIISTIVSINIAVYLFEIASPVRNSELELFSLPALYGAKINHLILYGEWWRLLTPMFLHTGILHIGLSCWALLTFGPQVCKAYGPFTFFLIYILGGLSGNLTSFLHTADPTVGGTGPVFAIIGAWLIYQYQNKDSTGKDVFDSMYQKAIVATALGFVLSTFGPIDVWTQFGSIFTGIAYGFFTCPTLQIDDSSETGKENKIRLVGQNVDPRKSLVLFSIFVMVLGSLLLIFEPPIGSLAIDTLV